MRERNAHRELFLDLGLIPLTLVMIALSQRILTLDFNGGIGIRLSISSDTFMEENWMAIIWTFLFIAFLLESQIMRLEYDYNSSFSLRVDKVEELDSSQKLQDFMLFMLGFYIFPVMLSLVREYQILALLIMMLTRMAIIRTDACFRNPILELYGFHTYRIQTESGEFLAVSRFKMKGNSYVKWSRLSDEAVLIKRYDVEGEQ